MPGVIVTTDVKTGGTSAGGPRSGQYFVVGLTQRGPINPTVVRSFQDFTAAYGDRVTYGYLYDDLNTFFREGGGQAVVKRVVGPGATTGTVTLKDAGGVNTLRIDAASPGAWSSDVSVQVSAGAVDGTFTLAVSYLGKLVNRYPNLATVSAAVDVLSTSKYVKGVDLGGGDPVPGAVTALSAGSDDRANVTAQVVMNGLNDFGIDFGAGAVAIPGYAADLIAGAVQTHCADNRRVGLLHLDQSAQQQDALDAAEAIVSTSGDNLGLFYPWVTIPGPGITPITVPPTGYVAAMRARAHREVGAWRVPAGDIAVSSFVNGVATTLSTVDTNNLNDGNVSVIRSFGSTIELYGYRSLSTDEATFPLLNKRDATNVVVEDLESIARPYLFGAVDAGGVYFQTLSTAFTGYLDPIRAAGGLYALTGQDGEEVDPGYEVIVNASNNTADTLAKNEVHAAVGLRWSPVAEFIYMTVTSVAVDAAF